MPLFGGRRSMLEVQNQALIKTARERAERIEELERELQSAASQIGQLRRELETAQGATGKLERDLQAVQDRTGKLERDFQAAQARSDIERDLQRASDEVKRLTLERDFYSNKASALEQENRELTESATKYSVHAQKLERELTEVATKYSLRAQKLERELTDGHVRPEARARIDRDGHPVLSMGSKVGTRTQQDRSGWCARAPIWSRRRRIGLHHKKKWMVF
jgi:chromosome segregation ATPase